MTKNVMRKKIKILYNISPILDGMENGYGRTGIYHCAYNILKEMLLRDDVELAFYGNMTGMCNYEKMKQVFGISNIPLMNESKVLTAFSRWWNAVDKKRVFFKRNGKKYRNYFLRIIELIIEAMADIYAALTRNPRTPDDFDIYFSPAQQPPKYILKNDNIQKVIVLHDTIGFIWPEFFPGMNHWWQKHWAKDLKNGMNNKELFFANSQNTKKDFLELKKEILPDRIKVIYHACSDWFVPCCDENKLLGVKKKYGIPADKKYVFSLCAIEPRKNLIRIVRTFIEFIKKNNINDLILILGGSAWTSFVNEFESSVGKIPEFSDIVYRIGYVDDEDLPILYSSSLFFVYTSQYEGFGVPPLEAMKCGCPVIVSDSSSIPEVAGDAGIQIKWDSDEQHIEAYEKYYFDEDLKAAQSQKSLLRAEDFSWKKSVDEMVNEMSAALGKE